MGLPFNNGKSMHEEPMQFDNVRNTFNYER